MQQNNTDWEYIKRLYDAQWSYQAIAKQYEMYSKQRISKQAISAHAKRYGWHRIETRSFEDMVGSESRKSGQEVKGIKIRNVLAWDIKEKAGKDIDEVIEDIRESKEFGPMRILDEVDKLENSIVVPSVNPIEAQNEGKYETVNTLGACGDPQSADITIPSLVELAQVQTCRIILTEANHLSDVVRAWLKEHKGKDNSAVDLKNIATAADKAANMRLNAIRMERTIRRLDDREEREAGKGVTQIEIITPSFSVSKPEKGSDSALLG